MSVIINLKNKEDQAMKKLFLIVVILMSSYALKAEGEANNYVTVGDKTYFCEKITEGLFNMNLTLENGAILKVPFKNVKSYSNKGKMYERLPVICKDAPENCTALMEYITSRNGLRLYKYSEVMEHGELYNNTYEKAHLEFEFFVFKEGKFYLHVTRENVESVLPFFGIKVI